MRVTATYGTLASQAAEPTFDGDFVFASAGVGEELHVDGHLPDRVIHTRACVAKGGDMSACSPCPP